MWILLVWQLTQPGVYQPYSIIQTTSQEECMRYQEIVNSGVIRTPVSVRAECVSSSVLGTNS